MRRAVCFAVVGILALTGMHRSAAALNPPPPIPGLTAINPGGGAAWLQTGDMTDPRYLVPYPRTSAPDAMAVVEASRRNPSPANQVRKPYRSRSWLGGALWGTGRVHPQYWSPNFAPDVPDPNNPSAEARLRAWTQINLKQYPVWGECMNLFYLAQLNRANMNNATNVQAGTITAGSDVVTVGSTAQLASGMQVGWTGSGTPYLATVQAILNATQIQLSAVAGAANDGAITFSGQTSPNNVGVSISGNYPFFLNGPGFPDSLPAIYAARTPLKLFTGNQNGDWLIQPWSPVYQACRIVQQGANSQNFVVYDLPAGVGPGTAIGLLVATHPELDGTYTVNMPGLEPTRNVSTASATQPSTITTVTNHHYTTNITVFLAGIFKQPENVQLPPQGFYQITVTGPQTFTVDTMGGGSGGLCQQVSSGNPPGYYVTIPAGSGLDLGTNVTAAAYTVAAPPNRGTTVTPAWAQYSDDTTNAAQNAGLMLVDRMGDFDVDCIYQNPADPYAYTANANGQGTYLKFTAMQHSPFIWVECRGISSVMLRQTMPMVPGDPSGNINPSGPNPYYQHIVYENSSAQVAGLGLPSGLGAAIVAGDVNSPNGSATNIQFNPGGSQDNWATYAVFYPTAAATFYNDLTSDPGNSHGFGTLNHRLDIANPTQKTWFVIAKAPTRFNYPGAGTFGEQANTWYRQHVETNALKWLKTLGHYAFNFPVNSEVSYWVTNGYRVCTRFAVTTTTPYPGFATATGTVFLLPPHQWQPVTLAPGVRPEVLNLAGAADLESSGDAAGTISTAFQYWNVRGKLKPVGGAAYQVEYLFHNFLPSLPLDTNLLNRTFTSAFQPGVWSNQPVGELIFMDLYQRLQSAAASSAVDMGGKRYISNTSSTYATAGPWNPMSYNYSPSAVYNDGYTALLTAQQAFRLQQYLQIFGGDFAGNPATSRAYYSTAATRMLARWPQLGVGLGTSYMPWIGSIVDENGFWADNKPTASFTHALELAMRGSASGVGGYFGATPVVSALSPAGSEGLTFTNTNFEHFGYYDADAATAVIHPISIALSTAAYPTRTNLNAARWGTIDSAITNSEYAMINEAFGLASNLDDQHYNYGGWIAAAALLAMLDGAWDPAAGLVAPSGWAAYTGGSGAPAVPATNSFIAAIDALVMSIAYDATVREFAVQSTDLRGDGQAAFAKLQYFDQVLGMGWADGLQAANAGGNGHNNNSVGEANGAFAAIALWGMATGRKQIADLGMYLYASAAQAADQYFYDKNNNQKPAVSGQTNSASASGSFVPVVTSATTMNSTYWPVGATLFDYAMQRMNGNSIAAAGTPLALQSAATFGMTFTMTPQSSFYIQCFPATAYTLLMARNPAYMAQWAAAIAQTNYAFNQMIGGADDVAWDGSFAPNLVLMQALCTQTNLAATYIEGQNRQQPTRPYPGTAHDAALDWFLNLMTTAPNTGMPPWDETWNGNTGQGLLQRVIEGVGDKTPGEMAAFLFALEQYGPPDWSIVGQPDNGVYVPCAAFTTPDNKTTYAAYNPGVTTRQVSFYDIDTGALKQTLQVPAKQWTITSARGQSLSITSAAHQQPGGLVLQWQPLGAVTGPYEIAASDRLNPSAFSTLVSGVTGQSWTQALDAAALRFYNVRGQAAP